MKTPVRVFFHRLIRGTVNSFSRILVFLFIACYAMYCSKEDLNTEPVCRISQPADGDTLSASDTVAVNISALDEDNNLSAVELRIGEELVFQPDSPPYVFTWPLKNLAEGHYTLIAWCKDKGGRSDADTISVFVTHKPLVHTHLAVETTRDSAWFEGSVQLIGLSPVTEYGFCWSTHTSPTVSDNVYKYENQLNKPSVFQGIASELSAGEKYYYRAYAVNASGISYGSQKVFMTDLPPGSEQVIDIDGNVYPVEKIHSQVWIAESLRTRSYPGGGAIADGTGKTDISSESSPAYRFSYDDDPVASDTLGFLYTWFAAVNYPEAADENGYIQGICPEGFRIPTDADFRELEENLGMNPQTAKVFGWRGKAEGAALQPGGGTGFDASMNGIRFGTGGYEYLGVRAVFWGADACDEYNAYTRSLENGNGQVSRSCNPKEFGFQLRCVRND